MRFPTRNTETPNTTESRPTRKSKTRFQKPPVDPKQWMASTDAAIILLRKRVDGLIDWCERLQSYLALERDHCLEHHERLRQLEEASTERNPSTERKQ
jgi:hypothetical protein